jgi:hypothetical protein
MSSSQGVKSQAVDGSVARAVFVPKQSIRDASDWTLYTKEIKVYSAPKRLQTEDPWIPYGTGYRLTFLNGKFKCTTCGSSAF